MSEQDYTSDMLGIIVVIDNCSDRIAEVASNFKTSILERNDSKRTGKGYAIKFALDNVEIGQYDAIFIIDMDTVVANGALSNLDQALKKGKKIIQYYYNGSPICGITGLFD